MSYKVKLIVENTVTGETLNESSVAKFTNHDDAVEEMEILLEKAKERGY